MNISFLTEYFTPVIAGIAICSCWVIRKTTDKLDRFIPLIAGLIGLVMSFWVYRDSISPATVLAGLFSGLSATGLYEAFDKMISGGESDERERNHRM